MDIVKIRPNEVNQWIKMIPLEILSDNGMRNTKMLGVLFGDEKAGAIVWSEMPDKVKLLSIYVDQGARRMGLGSGLIRAMRDEITKKKLALTEFDYAEEHEKGTLTPFLERFGGQIFKKTYPLGLVTLRDACRELLKHKVDPREQCSFSDLSAHEKNLLCSFITESTGLEPGVYFVNSPGYVVIDGDRPLGMMLMRDSYTEKTIYIDFLWAKNNPKALAKIVSAAFKYSLEQPDKDQKLVHFILATDESKKLYEAFFGTVEDEITLCKGFLDARVIDGV